MIIDMPTVSMGSSGSLITADRVAYDNDTSGLAADSVQDAIDEITMADGGLDGVIYYQGKPILTTKNVVIYIDGTNGNDNGMGTQASPFKTLAHALTLVPSTFQHIITFRLSGNLTAQGQLVFSGLKGNVYIFLDNNPTLFGMTISSCDFVDINGSYTSNHSSSTTVNGAGIEINNNSTVTFRSGTYTITGATGATYSLRGVHVGYGSNLINPDWSAARIVCNNCAYGFVIDSGSMASLNKPTYVGCTTAEVKANDSTFFKIT